MKHNEPKRCTLDDILSYLCSMEGDPTKLVDYVKCYIRKFDRQGDRNEDRFNALQIIILVASALTPFLNSFISTAFFGNAVDANTIKFYTSFLAVISAVSIGILQLTQAGDRMTLEKITRISLEKEILLYTTKAGVYSGTEKQPLSDDRRRKLFAQRVAEIIVNKFNKYYSFGPRGSRERDQNQDDNIPHSGSSNDTSPTTGEQGTPSTPK